MENLQRMHFYRQQAADCRKQAASAITPADVRNHWLLLAEQYDELAREAMRLSKTKREPLPYLPKEG